MVKHNVNACLRMSLVRKFLPRLIRQAVVLSANTIERTVCFNTPYDEPSVLIRTRPLKFFIKFKHYSWYE